MFKEKEILKVLNSIDNKLTILVSLNKSKILKKMSKGDLKDE